MTAPDNMTQLLPSNINEIERLILALYQTSDPDQRSQADRSLIELQRSPQGFQLADQLLHSSHEEVRFYGARTFIVKINKDIETLEEVPKQELLHRLVFWFVFATHHAYSATTLRKLGSALVAFFIQTGGTWSSCVSDVRSALITDAPQNASVDISNDVTMQDVDKTALLTFVSILLQEVKEVDADTPRSLKLNDAIQSNISIIMKCVQDSLKRFLSSPQSYSVAEDAVNCYHSLIIWLHTASHDEQTLELVRSLSPVIISQIISPVLWSPAGELICEVLTDWPLFFTSNIYSSIAEIFASQEAVSWLQRLVLGEFEHEPYRIGQLLVAYGEARVETMASVNATKGDEVLLRQLLVLLTCKGIPAAEDLIVSPALDFWSSFMDAAWEQCQEQIDGPEKWDSWKGGILRDLFYCLKSKAKHPETSAWKSLSVDEKKQFNYFRADVKDLLQTMTSCAKGSLTVSIISSILEESRKDDWYDLEASLFCLNAILSDGIFEGSELQELVAPVLQPAEGQQSVIEKIRSSVGIPVVIYREVVTFFSAIESLTKQDTSLLLLMLHCLADWFREKTLAMPSASVFARLCQHSRESVLSTGIGGDLMVLFRNYASMEDRDFAVMEKLAGAVAAIAQVSSNKHGEEGGMMLLQLLDITKAHLDESLVMQVSDPEKAQAMGISVLRCLECMGKAFRVPDQIINLDEDQNSSTPTFWKQNPGQTTAAQITILDQCTALLNRNNGPEEVVAVCQILKSGYTETEPGPFVFPLDATATLLKVCHLSTPSIGEVFKNVSILLEKHKSRSSTSLVLQFAHDCLQHVQSMVNQYFENDPSRDPEVAALVIDFIKAYTPQYNHVLISQSHQQAYCLDFALSCLATNEILPKQAAAIFWARFIKGPAGVLENEYNTVLDQYTEHLSKVLIHQICGGASRSDLEFLVEPLRAAVFKGGLFRGYMRQALSELDIQDNRVSETDKRVFLDKLFRYDPPKTSIDTSLTRKSSRWNAEQQGYTRILGTMPRDVRFVIEEWPIAQAGPRFTSIRS